MVLEHVSHDTGSVIVASSMSHVHGFRYRDLNVVDVVAVPEGFEDGVGKPEGQDVLNRLLAKVMINPVDLVFVEYRVDLPVQLLGTGKIVAEGFLYNDAAPPGAILAESGLSQLIDDQWVEYGWRCQVE